MGSLVRLVDEQPAFGSTGKCDTNNNKQHPVVQEKVLNAFFQKGI